MGARYVVERKDAKTGQFTYMDNLTEGKQLTHGPLAIPLNYRKGSKASLVMDNVTKKNEAPTKKDSTPKKGIVRIYEGEEGSTAAINVPSKLASKSRGTRGDGMLGGSSSVGSKVRSDIDKEIAEYEAKEKAKAERIASKATKAAEKAAGKVSAKNNEDGTKAVKAPKTPKENNKAKIYAEFETAQTNAVEAIKAHKANPTDESLTQKNSAVRAYNKAKADKERFDTIQANPTEKSKTAGRVALADKKDREKRQEDRSIPIKTKKTQQVGGAGGKLGEEGVIGGTSKDRIKLQLEGKDIKEEAAKTVADAKVKYLSKKISGTAYGKLIRGLTSHTFTPEELYDPNVEVVGQEVVEKPTEARAFVDNKPSKPKPFR